MGGKEALEGRVRSFNDELRANNIDLTVVMGAEYLLSPELLEEARQRWSLPEGRCSQS